MICVLQHTSEHICGNGGAILFGDDYAIIGVAIVISTVVVHIVVEAIVILNVKCVGIGAGTVAIWDIVIIGVIARDH